MSEYKLVDSTSLDSKFQNIADAIRSKTGKTDTMTLESMVSEIENISAGSEVSIKTFSDFSEVNFYLNGSNSLKTDMKSYVLEINADNQDIFVAFRNTYSNQGFNYRCGLINSLELDAPVLVWVTMYSVNSTSTGASFKGTAKYLIVSVNSYSVTTTRVADLTAVVI